MRVNDALDTAGALVSQKKPDLDKIADRPGHKVAVVNQVHKKTDMEFFDIPTRPDEATLRRISAAELLPPPTSAPVPLDFEFNPHEENYVADQRME